MTEDIYIANFGKVTIDMEEEEKVVEVLLRLEGVKCANYYFSPPQSDGLRTWVICDKFAAKIQPENTKAGDLEMYTPLCSSCYKIHQEFYQENR